MEIKKTIKESANESYWLQRASGTSIPKELNVAHRCQRTKPLGGKKMKKSWKESKDKNKKVVANAVSKWDFNEVECRTSASTNERVGGFSNSKSVKIFLSAIILMLNLASAPLKKLMANGGVASRRLANGWASFSKQVGLSEHSERVSGTSGDSGRRLGIAFRCQWTKPLLGIFVIMAWLLAAGAVLTLGGNVVIKDGELNVTDDFLVSTDVLFVNSASGNVGIGTTTPSQKLDVNGNINVSGDITSASSIEYNIGSSTMDNVSDVIIDPLYVLDSMGFSVSYAGDVNGDGYADVIVGAYFSNAGGPLSTWKGQAHILFGNSTMDNTPDVTMTGLTNEDRLGVVSYAGDVNGDGYADVIVGADHAEGGGIQRGEAYIYFGGSNMNNVADVTMSGLADNDYLGYSVSYAGDVNGDGYADVIVGSYYANINGTNMGHAHVYFGGPDMDGTAEFTMNGSGDNYYLGYSVSYAGDVNGDGYDDVIVGAYGAGTGGEAYIYLGGPDMDNVEDVTLSGATGGDEFGYDVSYAGDVNGDGYDDVIVGARGAGSGGEAYIYLGGPNMDNTIDLTMNSSGGGGTFGRQVSYAGDINGDGYSDVIIGDYSAGAGEAYIYFGGSNMDNTADITLGGVVSGDYFGYCVSYAGDVNGDGYDDVIVGAKKVAVDQINDGRAYVYYGSGNRWKSIFAQEINLKTGIHIGELTLNRYGLKTWTSFGIKSPNWEIDRVGTASFQDAIVGTNLTVDSGTLFVDGTNDNVGIGTTAPTQKLDVNGSVNVSGSSAKLYSPEICLDGDCQTVWPSGTGTDTNASTACDGAEVLYGNGTCGIISGSGADTLADVTGRGSTTTHPLTIDSDGDEQTTVGGNLTVDSGTLFVDSVNNKIGIGIITPTQKLDVNGNINVSGDITSASSIEYNIGSSTMDNVPDVTMDGPYNLDSLGWSVSYAGDVNGDGYADVIFGAYMSNAGGPLSTWKGQAHILFGNSTMDNTPDVTITGLTNGDRLGIVSYAGDVNGDGYSDVIVGADHAEGGGTQRGEAYIYFGGSNMNNVADVTMSGLADNDYLGYSVSYAGDVNGDGYADVVVGAYYANIGETHRGQAHVYFGGPDMDGTAEFTMSGLADNDYLGYSVSYAGDVNGDGYDDVIVGAYGAGTGGEVYIYFGGPDMDNVEDVTLSGAASGDEFGYDVSYAGDVNGDGYDDVIVGARGAGSEGEAYIYFGGPNMDNTVDITMNSPGGGGNFGRQVSYAGDINGDGYSDVIIGDYSAGAGGAYIYFGGSNMDNTIDITLYGEVSSDYFGYSVSYAGDVNGDGYDDVVIGAKNADPVVTNDGRAYVYYGSGNRWKSIFAQEINLKTGIHIGELTLNRYGLKTWTSFGIKSPNWEIDRVGTASFQDAIIGTNLTVDSGTLFVDGTNNRVGIGTTEPDAHLHVENGTSQYLKYDDSGLTISTNDATTSSYIYLRAMGAAKNTRIFTHGGTQTLALATNNIRSDIFIQSDGNVGIGTTTPGGYKLYVNGTVCLDINQNGVCDDDTSTLSDIRLKKNIAAIENPLEKIQQLKGINFDWKSEQYPELRLGDKRQIGMIAQEVEDILPEVVLSGVGDDNLKMIDYSRIAPLLIEGIKELKAEKDAEIESQQQQINELKAEIEWLKARI